MTDRANISRSEAPRDAQATPSSSLLSGLKARDGEAWRRLADLYGPLVYGWCRNRGLQPADAEDVLQEVFVTVASRIDDFCRDQAGATFRGWLSVITRNKIGDWLRRRQAGAVAAGGSDAQRALLEAPAADSTDSAAWPTPGEPGDLYRRAMDIIRTEFTERTWQAFWRVVIEAQAPADVAAGLGMSRNAVYLARSHVLRRLRDVLGEE